MKRWRSFVGPCAVIVLAAGCGEGDGLPRQAVWGTVKYDGQPLKSGVIQFSPDDPGMKDPVTGGSAIGDGSYSVDRALGLVPGKYKVSISSASSATAGGEAPGSGGALPKEALPAKYNTRSELTAEIKAGESKAIDFELAK